MAKKLRLRLAWWITKKSSLLARRGHIVRSVALWSDLSKSVKLAFYVNRVWPTCWRRLLQKQTNNLMGWLYLDKNKRWFVIWCSAGVWTGGKDAFTVWEFSTNSVEVLFVGHIAWYNSYNKGPRIIRRNLYDYSNYLCDFWNIEYVFVPLLYEIKPRTWKSCQCTAAVAIAQRKG